MGTSSRDGLELCCEPFMQWSNINGLMGEGGLVIKHKEPWTVSFVSQRLEILQYLKGLKSSSILIPPCQKECTGF